MHPVLIELGWFTIHSYGFMLAVSFLVGIFTAKRRASAHGIDPTHIMDLSVYIILAAVIGSRLLYVAFHLEEYRNILDMFALWQGGATLYGGLILTVIVSFAFATKRRMHFLDLADIISPSIALGIASVVRELKIEVVFGRLLELVMSIAGRCARVATDQQSVLIVQLVGDRKRPVAFFVADGDAAEFQIE